MKLVQSCQTNISWCVVFTDLLNSAFSVGLYHGSCAFCVGVVWTYLLSPRAAQSTLVRVVMFSKVFISGTIFSIPVGIVRFLRCTLLIVSKVKSCQNQKPNAKSLRRATPQVRVAAVATRRCELPLCQHSRSATTTIRRRSRDPPLICMLHHVLSQTFTQQSPFECHSSECTSYPNVVDGNLLK